MRWFVSFLSACTICFSPLAWSAIPVTTVEARGKAQRIGSNSPELFDGSSGAEIQTAYGAYYGPGGSFSARAFGAAGTLKAAAFAWDRQYIPSEHEENDTNYSAASARAEWQDTIKVVSNKEETGLGIYSFYLAVDGKAGGASLGCSVPYSCGVGSGEIYASVTMYHEYIGNYRDVFTYYAHGSAPGTLGSEVFTEEHVTAEPYLGGFRISVPIKLNTERSLKISLLANASASASFLPGSWTAGTADAEHSLYWGGSIGLIANEVGVDDFTVESGSGLDYMRSYVPAVPEPEISWLMLSGLLLLSAITRPRQGDCTYT